MKIILAVVALALCTSAIASNVAPAARVDVPVDQLNSVKDQLLRSLINKIEGAKIPDVNLTKKILFWDIGIALENINVDYLSLDFYSSGFEFQKPKTINAHSYVQQTNLSFDLTLKLVKTINLGKVVVRMSKTPISFGVDLDTTQDHKFSVQIENLKSTFGPLDLTLSTKESEGLEIVEMILQTVGNSILKKDGAKILGSLQTDINKALSSKMGKLDLQVPVPGTDLVIDLSPVGKPVVTSE